MARRRTGFVATLAVGVGLLGASLHGLTGVDRELRLAASPTPAPSVVLEHQVRDGCERPHHHRRGGEV